VKFYTAMPKTLKPFYHQELDKFYAANQNGDLKEAWSHLERAHIIGQRYPLEHSYVHWKMLAFGFKIKSGKEIFGQLPRLLVGGVNVYPLRCRRFKATA